jgi:hypothetical protein
LAKGTFQTELFYLDDTNLLREWNFVNSYTGANGSLSSFTFTSGTSSRLVSYWPSIIFQDGSNQVQGIVYNWSEPGNKEGWYQSPLDLRGWNGSGLAAVPLRQDYADGGVNLFYQRDDQKLLAYSGNISIGWSVGRRSVLNYSDPFSC